MSKHALSFLCSLVILILSGCSSWESPESLASTNPGVRATDTPEAEVKAAFVNIMRVAQTKHVDNFRQLINPKDVVEFDADEGDHKGSYEAFMADIVSHPLKDYRIALTGSEATFRAEPQQKIGVYDKPKTTEILLVKIEGQWKIGRLASSNRALSQLDTMDARPTPRTTPKTKRLPKATPH